LINEGIIDYIGSKIDSRQNIYYPLVMEKISITSITNPIDNYLPNSLPIYEKIIKNVTKDWISNEIRGLVRYRLEHGGIEELDQYVNDPEKFQILGSIEELDQYVNDPEKFQILDSNLIHNEYEEQEQEKRYPLVLSIDEFIYKYCDIVKTSIDIQRSKN
jgi:hypothetical protein